MEQGVFIVLAQRGANAHVSNDGAGNTRRKPLGRNVAAGAVLLEDAFAIILRLTALIPSRVFVWLGLRHALLLRGNCKY